MPRARQALLAPLRLFAISRGLPPEGSTSSAPPPPKTLEFPRKAAKAQRQWTSRRSPHLGRCGRRPGRSAAAFRRMSARDSGLCAALTRPVSP
jgi:hypothetical protein